jgi:multiple sugar transport system substrate-binding protein
MSKFRIFIVVSLLIAILVAPVAAQDPVEITFMRFFGLCDDEFADNTDLDAAYGECGIIQTLTNVFNASQDEVVVKTVVVDWPGFTELNANLAAGTAPDIMVLHGHRIPNYASRGLLTPMGDILNAAGIDTTDYTENALGSVEWNGEMYGMPLDVHGHLWHINLDLWDQAGLLNDDGSPKLPHGKEEFMAAAEQFKEATGLPFLGMWVTSGGGLSRNWMTLVYQQGGSIENEDGSPNVNTEEGMEALNLLLEMRDAGYISDNVDYAAAEQLFLNCETGSHINGTWVVNFYDEQVADPDGCLKNYYVSSFPTIYDTPAAWSGNHTWIIPQGLDPDPVKLEATLKFLKFLNDNNIEWAKTGHTSVRKSVINSDAYNSLPHRDEYKEFVTSAIIFPRGNWATAYEDIVDEELQAVFIGDKTPEEGLAAAQARLDDFAMFGQ